MIHKSNLRHIVNDYNIIDDIYTKSYILSNIGLLVSVKYCGAKDCELLKPWIYGMV